jgi:hypothetical protein
MKLYVHEFGSWSWIRVQLSRISRRDLQEFKKSYKGVQGTFYRIKTKVLHKVCMRIVVLEYKERFTKT